MNKDGWSKRFKGAERGGAWIYTHAKAIDGRAIVVNHAGIAFNGVRYRTLEDAKRAAIGKPAE